MALDVELVAKGKREPLEGLKAQGRQHLQLIAEHPKVKAFGWTDEETRALETNLALISTAEAARTEASDASRLATIAQEKAVDDAKHFIASMRNVQAVVLRKARQAGVVIEKAMPVSGVLGRSVPTLLSYLTNAEPVVKRLDAYFKPYLNMVASERLAELRNQLEAADSKQEAARSATPELTGPIYEAKGHVVEAIETLNAIAKNAFRGEAAVIGRFNKDLLFRARRERAEKQAQVPA